VIRMRKLLIWCVFSEKFYDVMAKEVITEPDLARLVNTHDYDLWWKKMREGRLIVMAEN
jgi:hypothetical protein